MNVLAGPKSKLFLCQPTMVVDQACNQFSGQSRLLKIMPLRETFQLQQTNKNLMGKNLGFFHLGTTKTAFFIRNLPIDARNLGIFPNKQDHSKKRAEETSPSFLAWESRRTNFVNELIVV